MSVTPVSSVSSSPSPSPPTGSVSPSPVLPVSPPVRESGARFGAEIFPLSIIVGAIWIMLFTTFVTWNAVIYGCIHFISSFVTCVGLLGILIIATLPIVYAIIPQQTQNFKFVSLCPGIEYAFDKLDNFITGAKQYITERM
jgi:hypothetical protein